MYRWLQAFLGTETIPTGLGAFEIEQFFRLNVAGHGEDNVSSRQFAITALALPRVAGCIDTARWALIGLQVSST